ncbi:MAG: 2-hydroxyacyl-CoA dehydratase family protein [Eubacteriaceae bacterium]|nr:2-hydroxyacyl-CoA dehydratase family protein [Eubacteriaceae bacterium]
MNKTVETFGKIVEDNIDTSPGFARGLLKAGFSFTGLQFKYRPNKKLPPSKQYAASVCMDALLQPLKKPEKSAIVNIFLPCEMLHITGTKPLVAEQVSCYTAGAASEQGMLKASEGAGVPPTMCSYHRILTGAAFSGILGRPRFIANTTMVCDANINTFRFLADHYDVPHFTVDTPMSSSPEAVHYVADQLRQLKKDMEDATEVTISEEELKKRVKLSEESVKLYGECLEAMRNKYVSTDLTSEMYSILMGHSLLGTGQAKTFYRKLLEDCREAPAYRGRNRIMWMHTIPNCQNSMCDIFNYSEKNQMLVSDLTTDYLDAPTDDDPYVSMANRLQFNTFNSTFEVRGRRAIQTARQLNANGIILFTHWGCRGTAGGVRIMEDMAREEGVPLLVLDGDGCDLKNINEGQMVTRVEAFLEMLEETK